MNKWDNETAFMSVLANKLELILQIIKNNSYITFEVFFGSVSITISNKNQFLYASD